MPEGYLGNISVMWRGEGWFRGLGHTGWCQAKLRELPTAGTEDGLGPSKHLLWEATSAPGAGEGHSQQHPTSSGGSKRGRGDTNPRIVPAVDFCHGAQPCRANRAAAAALLTPTPSWGYSFSAAFLFQRWFSYHRSLARSRNICGGQKEVKRFQLQLGSSDTSFQIKASLFALAHPTSRAAHNFLELCLSQEQFVANDLL